jgi:hypothetical protein
VIPVAQLAQLLDTSPQRVNKLIKLGYLKGGKGRQVELPPRSALQWLKQMLLPLPRRPLFTIPEILGISGLPLKLFRRIVLAWDIPLHYDPAFGELISPDSLITLINALHSIREPVRFDRIVLLTWMQGLGSNKYVRPKLPYSRLIDLEIKRIAHLPEPERTTAANAFYNAYKDARRVSHVIDRKGRKNVGGNYVREEMIQELEGEIKDVLVDSTKPTSVALARKAAKKARKRRERWDKGIVYRKERNFKPSAPLPAPDPLLNQTPELDPPPLPDTSRDEEPQ